MQKLLRNNYKFKLKKIIKKQIWASNSHILLSVTVDYTFKCFTFFELKKNISTLDKAVLKFTLISQENSKSSPNRCNKNAYFTD